MARRTWLAGTIAAVLLWQGPALAASTRIMSADEIAAQLVRKRSIGGQAVQRVDLPTVTFEFNSDRLTPQARTQLDELAKALNYDAFKGIPFAVGGHTDALGTESYNQTLSERRAEAVQTYLARQHEFDSAKIKPVGFGKSQPDPRYAPNAAEQRRVVIELTPSG